MDYLCTCINDKSIRMALHSLPPTLVKTYERILDKVAASGPDVQRLVKNVLKWTICVKVPLSKEALLEAISISEDEKELDRECMPDEESILKWCSSLVRMTANGTRLELAHFTVKEFILSIGSKDRLAEYGIQPASHDLELSKLCLTYLEFDTFQTGISKNADDFNQRSLNNPFLHYAATQWPHHAYSHTSDEALFELLKTLFHPSKSGQFLTWSQCWKYGLSQSRKMAIVSSTTTLHWSAIIGLQSICNWLLKDMECGADINKMSLIGTPLCCALSGRTIFAPLDQRNSFMDSSTEYKQERDLAISSLLDAGAFVNGMNICPHLNMTPLALTLELGHGWELLLASGAVVDASVLVKAEQMLQVGRPYVSEFFQAAENQPMSNEIRLMYVFDNSYISLYCRSIIQTVL